MTAQTAVYFTIKHSLSLSLLNKNTDADAHTTTTLQMAQNSETQIQ